jgi:DHA1 family tetracycline resistance protein-like MFS transporter
VDASRNLFLFLVTGILGRASDMLGRKPLLILSAICTLLPLVFLLAFPNNLAWYFSAYALAGLLGGQLSPAASAFIADTSSSSERSIVFGYIGAAIAIVFAIGPTVGTFISETCGGLQVLFSVAVFLGIINVIYIACFVPESFRLTQQGQSGATKTHTVDMLNPFSPLFLLSKSSVVRLLCAISGLLAFTRSGEGTITFFFLKEKLGYNAEDISFYYFAVRGVIGVVIQTFLIKWLVAYFERRNLRVGKKLPIDGSAKEQWAPELYLMTISQVVMMLHVLGYVLIVFLPGRKMLGLVLILTDEFGNMGTAAISGILSKNLDNGNQGFGLGTLSSVTQLCSVFGPVMFGWVYAYYTAGGGAGSKSAILAHEQAAYDNRTLPLLVDHSEEVSTPNYWAMSFPFFMLLAINLLAFFLTVHSLPACLAKANDAMQIPRRK